MSIMDELRAKLDELGVEWDYGITGATTTRFRINGVDLTFMPMRDGLVCTTILTPEQAIAATLGSCNVGRYVGLRQGEYWERTENSNYYCGGCGWKVTDHDSYCPECGGALHEYALGTGTCNVESSIIDTYEYNRWEYELSCGHTIIWEDSEPPRYCPACGRRIEQ